MDSSTNGNHDHLQVGMVYCNINQINAIYNRTMVKLNPMNVVYNCQVTIRPSKYKRTRICCV